MSKLHQLRQEMKAKGLSAYLIPNTDAHLSEYIAEHWKTVAWLSGFTGSNATILISQNEAIVWTDSRYYLQAEQQLEGSEFRLGKTEGEANYTNWLLNNLKAGEKAGLCGAHFSKAGVSSLKKKLADKDIQLSVTGDLADNIWTDRPSIPLNEIFIHPLKFSGQSAADKIKTVREKMEAKTATHFVVSTLDDIAWLYNIRGSDVECNPVAIAYALISREEALLFINDKKVPATVKTALKKEGINLIPYDAIYDYLRSLDKPSVVIYDQNKLTENVFNTIPKDCRTIHSLNITTGLKAVKNQTEIANTRKVMERDGVAMVHFLKWLEDHIGKTDIDEVSAADRLEGFRREQEGFVTNSFAAISGYKGNGAIVHYKPEKETCATLHADGLYLIDSGGQYLDGTTDITRTLLLGKEASDEAKRDYTLVLKGHIALAMAKFPEGIKGYQLDSFARQAMWEAGINYGHGTGHGVGCFLNVHEGPHSISKGHVAHAIPLHSITSNEPGIYRTGKHGIRIENLILCVESEKNDFGQFYEFETLTLCPIDMRLINVDMLTDKELEWFNQYHHEVYERLSPHLDETHRQWLEHKTKVLSKNYWVEFYKKKQDNPPRKLLLQTLDMFKQTGNQKENHPAKKAVDLGCGNGHDTRHLLNEGWQVYAIDNENAVISYLFEGLTPAQSNRLHFQCTSFEKAVLEDEVDLINAAYSLPFGEARHFEKLWQNIVRSIKSGGRFAGQFFGNRDEWDNLLLHRKEEVESLFEKDFTIEFFQEEEKDMPSALGPVKHWHIFHVIARKK